MCKKILIVAATLIEVKPLFEFIHFKTIKTNNFYSSRYNENLTVDLLITGIGMVATCFHTTQALHKNQYDVLLNVGIAGTFEKTMQLGELVIINHDCFAEMGIQKEHSIEPIIIKEDNIPLKIENEIVNNYVFNTGIAQNIKHVKGITVQSITATKQRATYFKNTYNAVTESMEGASFLYVCHALKQPCLQIRSISNRVGESNKKHWEIQTAVRNLSTVIFDVLQDID